MNNRSRKNGFTLAEILIAAAIIFTIVSMVYGSYFATSKSTQACKAKIAQSQRGRKVLEQMARQIRCSYAHIAKEHKHSARTAFQKTKTIPKNTTNYFTGNADDPSGEILYLVTTYATPLTQDHSDGLFEATYKFDRNTGILFLGQSRFVGVRKDMVHKNWQVIAENITRIELAFFDGQQWLKVWDFDDKENLPCAVKITITFQDENNHQYHCGTIAHVYCGKNQRKETQSDTLLSIDNK